MSITSHELQQASAGDCIFDDTGHPWQIVGRQSNGLTLRSEKGVEELVAFCPILGHLFYPDGKPATTFNSPDARFQQVQ